MKIDFKTVEKNSKIYEKIKAIDLDIIKLDKLARLISEGEQAEFKLSVSKAKDEPKKEESCSYTSGGFFSQIILSGSGYPSVSVTNIDNNHFESKISETLSYEILALLISKKNEERNKLISKLK